MLPDKCSNEANRYDVIIIGAGLSGLHAASILKQQQPEIRLCVLEARDRVGGRTLTKKSPQVGGFLDLGGSYVGPSQLHMQRLIKRLNLKTYKVYDQGKSVYLNKKQRFLYDSDRLPPTGNKLVELEIKRVLALLKGMSEQINRDEPWEHPRAREWDLMTLNEFLDRNCWSREAKGFVSIYLGCCTSGEPYEESLLWVLWYIKQCDGMDIMFNTTDGAQDSKIFGGTQQLSECLCAEIGFENVKLNQPVVQIVPKVSSSVNEEMIVQTLDGSKYLGRAIIMAIPPAMWQKIHYSFPLPSWFGQMMQKFSMGSAIKCIVYYEQAFWRDQSLNGNLMINSPFTVDGPITYSLDDTKPDGSFPAIVGFLIGDRAREMLTKTKEERLKFIALSFARAFKTDQALKPIHYEEKNWMTEQYTGGCFTGLGAPGFLTNYGPWIFGQQQPLKDCIFLAGSETSSHWSGYMEGALQAGERAANQVCRKLFS